MHIYNLKKNFEKEPNGNSKIENFNIFLKIQYMNLTTDLKKVLMKSKTDWLQKISISQITILEKGLPTLNK